MALKASSENSSTRQDKTTRFSAAIGKSLQPKNQANVTEAEVKPSKIVEVIEPERPASVPEVEPAPTPKTSDGKRGRKKIYDNGKTYPIYMDAKTYEAIRRYCQFYGSYDATTGIYKAGSAGDYITKLVNDDVERNKERYDQALREGKMRLI